MDPRQIAGQGTGVLMEEAAAGMEAGLVFGMPESRSYPILELVVIKEHVAHLFCSLNLSRLQHTHPQHLSDLDIAWLLL